MSSYCPLDFTDKRVVVTGGASGIGRATVEAFREAGALVAAFDIDIECVSISPELIGIPCDVSDPRSIEAAFRALWGEWDSLDVLVNNVGIEYTESVETMSEQSWDRVFDVNLKSVFLCSKQALPALRSVKGCIVNTASQLAFVGVKGLAAYSASKAAMIGFTRSLALEEASAGIRVNCVCPGAVDTPMISRQFQDEKIGPQGTMSELVNLHPMGRLANASEIASCILFLASPMASIVTGTALIADGGYIAR